jgi:phosphoenolpyruvate phosphomutase
MKALILNSGLGRRMGVLTCEQPKCLTEIAPGETILGRQLAMIAEYGITEVVITTGYCADVLKEYCNFLDLPLHYTFVHNPEYDSTNYIWSICLAKDALAGDDILLMHGDLVCEAGVFDAVASSKESCMAVSTTSPLPQKDFKAVLNDGRIESIGIQFFDNAVAAQPLYKILKDDWAVWADEIGRMCAEGDRSCYAENAFNRVSARCHIVPLDVKDMLCSEIDTPEDLATVSAAVREIASRTVYMCFSTDYIHSGHISIIKKAARLGRVTVGVLSDEAVASYRRFPLMPFRERRNLMASIAGVAAVVEQKTLSYADNIRLLKPDFVVHGDDWQEGLQKPIREEVIAVLAEYGGRLVEFPYSRDARYTEIDKRQRAELAMPDMRRGRLRKLLGMKGLITALEAHSGLTGLIAENTTVLQDGKTYQFDAMWLSSLCDSTAKGKPDTELVDMTSRFRTVDDIMEVTTKPIIFDGDTGGLVEHFVYTVRSLERMGVSMVIIEDKTGHKMNSLFGTEVPQQQADVAAFCAKIAAGKKAQKTRDFMICARIESLILERGMQDAIARARAYVAAGADAIMIHSRKEDPAEVFEFVRLFRETDAATPLVVVPTSFNSVTEDEFKARGVNVVIYANQLTRSGFPAMQNAARSILEHHRAKECDSFCISIKDIITLIPED